jgi:hypothetical protein
MAHRAYPALPEAHIRTKLGKAFTDGTEDPAIQIPLLLGEQTVNKRSSRPSGYRPCS